MSDNILPEQYQHLSPMGTELRFNHEECGDTRGRLYVLRTELGWKYHCHNCAPKCSGFHRRDIKLSAGELVQVMEDIYKKHQQYQEDGERLITLPNDFTSAIPDRGRAWLYKYGITDVEIEEHNFGYSPKMNRLIMPLIDEYGEVLYWQARNLGIISKKTPKYLNMKSTRSSVFKEVRNVKTDYIVLVEDILSAIKVGRCAEACAILGSYIPPTVYPLIRGKKGALIWLDPDKRNESIRESARLTSLLNIPVFAIPTDKDPKEYSTLDISEVLKIAEPKILCA